uniref:HAT C-terminal dimerisation domain-containing protein n=1 Tax=Sipha flava TaxID=143950 RepID=A0A2S2PWP2_9HEMI
MTFDFDNPVLKSLDDLNPKKVFSNNRSNSIISFIQLFPRLIKKYNIQKIDDGWRKLNTVELEPEYIIKHKTLNFEEFWVNLKNKEVDNEYPFRVLSNFLLTVLSLRQSNVSCERMFSKINLIKTKQCNRLQTPTLNGLLMASQCMQETTCCKFEPSQNIYNLMTSSNLYSNLNSKDNDDDEIVFMDV